MLNILIPLTNKGIIIKIVAEIWGEKNFFDRKPLSDASYHQSSKIPTTFFF